MRHVLSIGVTISIVGLLSWCGLAPATAVACEDAEFLCDMQLRSVHDLHNGYYHYNRNIRLAVSCELPTLMFDLLLEDGWGDRVARHTLAPVDNWMLVANGSGGVVVLEASQRVDTRIASIWRGVDFAARVESDGAYAVIVAGEGAVYLATVSHLGDLEPLAALHGLGVREVAMSQDVLALGTDDRIGIVDRTDPGSFEVRSWVDNPRHASFGLAGRALILDSEDDGAGMWVYDLSNADAPLLVRTGAAPAGRIVAAVNGHLLVVHDEELDIVDLTDVQRPFVTRTVCFPHDADTVVDVMVPVLGPTSYWRGYRLDIVDGHHMSNIKLQTASCHGLEVSSEPAAYVAGGPPGILSVTHHDATGVVRPARELSAESTLGEVGRVDWPGPRVNDPGRASFDPGLVPGEAEIRFKVDETWCDEVLRVPIHCPDSIVGPPAAVDVVAAGPWRMAISWSDVYGSEGYHVVRDDGLDVGRTASLTTAVFDEDVSPGEQHCYRVSAVSGCGIEAEPTPPVCARSPGQDITAPWRAGRLLLERPGTLASLSVVDGVAAAADPRGLWLWRLTDPTSLQPVGSVELAGERLSAGTARVAVGRDGRAFHVDSELLTVVDIPAGGTVRARTAVVLGAHLGHGDPAVAVAGTTVAVSRGSSVDFFAVTPAGGLLARGSVPGSGMAGDPAGSTMAVAVADGIAVFDVSGTGEPRLVSTVTDLPPGSEPLDVAGSRILVGSETTLTLLQLEPGGGTTGHDLSDLVRHELLSAAIDDNRIAVLAAAPTRIMLLNVADPDHPAIGSVRAVEAPGEMIDLDQDVVWLAFPARGLAAFAARPGLPELAATGAPGEVLDLAADGPIGLLADGHAGVVVLDLTAATSPRVAARLAFSAAVTRVEVAATVGFVATGGTIHVLDLADPDEPRITAEIEPFGDAVVADLSTSGDELLTTRKDEGQLALYEFADPSAPVRLRRGTTATGGVIEQVVHLGSWAVCSEQTQTWLLDVAAFRAWQPDRFELLPEPYPAVALAVSGNRLALAAADSGLMMIDVTDPRNAFTRWSDGLSAAAVGARGQLIVAGDGATLTATDDVPDLASLARRSVDLIRPLTGVVVGDGVALAAADPYIEVIELGPIQLAAEFEATLLGNVAVFEDRTRGWVAEREWDFGDGTTSTAVHPIHGYAAPGIYDIVLRVVNDNDSNVMHRAIQIVGDGPTGPVRPGGDARVGP